MKNAFYNVLALPFLLVAVVLFYLVCTHTSFLSSVMGMATNQHAVVIEWPSLIKVAHASNAQPTSSTVTVKPTIRASYIDTQLCSHGSPACHTGQALYDLGVKYGVDPAFALAFFEHESSYGTKGIAPSHHSLSNMRCSMFYLCVDGYASFPSWQVGYEAWYQLITSKTYAGGGRVTVEAIIPIYAPNADHNDETVYISAVESSVARYRAESN